MNLADLSILLIPVGLALAIGLVGFWIWMLVDCLTRETASGSERIVWTMVILLTKLFGAALYFFLRYRRRTRPLAANAAA